MSLQRETRPSDEVRAPRVPRGKAIIVTRYRKEVAKVALVNPEDLTAARKGSDAEFTFLVPGKARPVLVLSDQADERLEELIALRLIRLSALTDRERSLVRSNDDPGLYYLDPEVVGLREENAAIIPALARIHRSASDEKPVGRIDEDDLRAIHERVAMYYGLDLRGLVRLELERLAEAQKRRRG